MSGGRGRRADTGEVTEETMALVAGVRERAASAPGPEELARLLAAARERSVTTDEVARAGAIAIAKAQQVSYMLGRLAGLVGAPAGGGEHG